MLLWVKQQWLMCFLLAVSSSSIAVHQFNHPVSNFSIGVQEDGSVHHNSLRENVPNILLHIFTDTYIVLSNTVVIVPGCAHPDSMDVQNDILEQLLSRNRDILPVELQTNLTRFDPHAVSFVWFIDSLESFREIFLGQYEHQDQLSNQGYYTVVMLEKLPVEDQLILAEEIFSTFWIGAATNVLLLTPEEQRTTFYTYFAYSNGVCGSPQTVAHNYYWHHSTDSTTKQGFEFDRPLFPRKCANLFNCPIKVATFPFPPFMLLSERNNGTETYFDGIEGIVVRVLSQRLHFKPVLVLPEDTERWGACDETQTKCNGTLKLLLEGKANMTIGLFGTNTYRGYDTLTNTIAYFMVKVVFAVPRGRPVTNLEKLLLPMQFLLWCCILACFCTGFLVIVSIRLYRKEVRQFVLGRNNRQPITTMISVWLGNSVSALPGRNFARFLLMMWILLAFVLRSAYQGALFDILRLKKTLAPLNTLQKMADGQYRVYVSQRLVKYIKAMDRSIQSLVRVVPTTEIDGLLLKTLDTSFNGVVVVVEPTILHFNKYKVPDGYQLIYSPVVITNIQNTIYMDKSSCILDAVNQELWMYLSSGLIHAWATKFLKDSTKEKHAGDVFMAMTLADVMGIFQVYGFLLAVVLMVFIGEVIYFRIKRKLAMN